MAEPKPFSGVDASKPSPARLYDYYLGGTDNLRVDREAAEAIRTKMPELEDAAWANRGFLQRAARWLAAECGIRQFIDIGAGLPTQNNTHEVVQRVAPDTRVAYIDNDPMVLTHARALLAGNENTVVITADLRNPDQVLGDADLRGLIDFAEPVGLLLVAVMHFVADDVNPPAILRRYMDSFAPGSCLALSHITADKQPPGPVQAIYDVYANATEQIRLRSKADVERLFDGLELVPPYEGAEPAVTFVGEWGAEDPAAADSDGSRWSYCGVARRP